MTRSIKCGYGQVISGNASSLGTRLRLLTAFGVTKEGKAYIPLGRHRQLRWKSRQNRIPAPHNVTPRSLCDEEYQVGLGATVLSYVNEWYYHLRLLTMFGVT